MCIKNSVQRDRGGRMAHTSSTLYHDETGMKPSWLRIRYLRLAPVTMHPSCSLSNLQLPSSLLKTALAGASRPKTASAPAP